MTDAVISRLRDEIDGIDRDLLVAMNRRLEVVGLLHEHKVEHGIPLRDPGREQSMLALLGEANQGPLSAEGLAGFFRHVLDLTRRELHGE